LNTGKEKQEGSSTNSGLGYQTKEDILLHITTTAVDTVKDHSTENSTKGSHPPTMDSNIRVTMSRGGGMGRTPRDRPPTRRTSGATSVLRTPSPKRARRSASRESTTALPNKDEQMDIETQPSQENQPNITAPSAPEAVQP